MSKLLEIAKKLVKGVGGNVDGLISRKDDGLPDYETRDRHLKSLRRQDRRIMDAEEKAYLRTKINRYYARKNGEIIGSKGIIKGRSKKKPPSVVGKYDLFGNR